MKKVTKTEGTALRQALFDTIFVLENLVILIVAHDTLHEELPRGLLVYIALSQYFGIALKCIYYWKFHIWSTTFDYKKPYRQIRDSSMNNYRRKSRIRNTNVPEQTDSLV